MRAIVAECLADPLFVASLNISNGTAIEKIEALAERALSADASESPDVAVTDPENENGA